MSVIDFDDYRKLLEFQIGRDKKPGAKARLARAVGCQPAYLSRVLADQADLNADQVARAARHFHLPELESEFWVYLLLENRSEEAGARAFFKKGLAGIRKKLSQLQHRLEASREKLPAELEMKYYSSWLLPALHMAIGLNHLQDNEATAKALGIRQEEFGKAIVELVEMGLATVKNDKVVPTSRRLHLGVESPWVSRYHANWRIKTLERLSRGDLSGLHYSSAISCSNDDLEKIRELFVATIAQVRSLVKDSIEETVAHYAVDFYNLIP